MANITSYDDYVYPRSLMRDVLVGGWMFFTCLLIIIFYIPCLMAIARNDELWKHSCYKVR